MRGYFEFFKLVWNDEKGKALIKLFLYLVFIIIAVFYIRATKLSSKQNKIISPIDNFKNMTNYTETIKINDSKYELDFNDYTYLKDETNTYQVLNNKIISMTDHKEITFDIYFWNITPSKLVKLIDKKEVYSNTSYNDGTKSKTYKIKLVDFIKEIDTSLNLDLIEEINDEELDLIIYEKDKRITSIELYLSKYYQLKNKIYKDYNIKIEY